VALGSAGDSIAKLQTYGAPMCSAMYGCCAYAVCGMRYAVCGMRYAVSRARLCATKPACAPPCCCAPCRAHVNACTGEHMVRGGEAIVGSRGAKGLEEKAERRSEQGAELTREGMSTHG